MFIILYNFTVCKSFFLNLSVNWIIQNSYSMLSYSKNKSVITDSIFEFMRIVMLYYISNNFFECLLNLNFAINVHVTCKIKPLHVYEVHLHFSLYLEQYCVIFSTGSTQIHVEICSLIDYFCLK